MTVISLKTARLDRIAARINTAHAKAADAASKAVIFAVEAGNALLEAKYQIGHGRWENWLERNVSFSSRTARRYMRLALIVPTLSESKRTHVSDLALREAIKAISETNTQSIMSGSDNVEWYTPKDIVARAIATMGAIDLDPCWSPQSPVKAKRKFRKSEDGLSKRWRGRVYLNPPYSRVVGDWTGKLIAEYKAGNVTEAIILVASRTDAQWFSQLDEFARCFIRGRLQFHNADQSAPFPSVAIYVGKNVRKFAGVFGEIGSIFVKLK